eukprot:gnl/MRDRNA2_/MRDRNA2_128851_c0_seq1.p1 gnl/MRDRNA2_/MRDRNA2_128851_c0~~gnl/MRDRNA2_/MRDRNA2_128851_c0_seq1.p1  ORF type:complete len:443 (+),score=65.29 gnl/MRDRNA2_/MRDRNA2_128851_c0_seq1:62-1330(+)
MPAGRSWATINLARCSYRTKIMSVPKVFRPGSPGRWGSPVKAKAVGSFGNDQGLNHCVSSTSRPLSAPPSSASSGYPIRKTMGRAGQGVQWDPTSGESPTSISAWSEPAAMTPRQSPIPEKKRPESAPLHPWRPRPVGTPRYPQPLSGQHDRRNSRSSSGPSAPSSRPQSAPTAQRPPLWRPPGKSGHGVLNASSPSESRAGSPSPKLECRSPRSESPRPSALKQSRFSSADEEKESEDEDNPRARFVDVDNGLTEEVYIEERRKDHRQIGSCARRRCTAMPARDSMPLKPKRRKNPSPFSADARSVQRAALEKAEVVHRTLQEDLNSLRKAITHSICATFSQDELSQVQVFGDAEATKTMQLLTDFAGSLPRTSPLYQKASLELAAVACQKSQQKKAETLARLASERTKTQSKSVEGRERT